MNYDVGRKITNFSFALAVGLLASLAFRSTSSAQTAPARTFKASAVSIKASDGTVARRIYTEIYRAPRTAPIVVLLNGLIYELPRWQQVAQALAEQNLTVIKMSFSPQPESLRLLEEGEIPSFLKAPSFPREGLELSDLADDIRAVLDHHRIEVAVTMVGLSYGAAAATEFANTFPARVANVVLLSPLVVPLDNYNPASAPLRSMLETVRFWEDTPCRFYGWLNPWLCTATNFWYDSFYDYFFETYLKKRVTRIPDGIDPALYKKSIFQMVRATRNFNLKTEIALLKNVHVVIAQGDEPNLLADQRLAWSLVPTKERRSFAEVTDVTHALPDEAPHTTASWIRDIVTGAPGLQNGEEYIVEGK